MITLTLNYDIGETVIVAEEDSAKKSLIQLSEFMGIPYEDKFVDSYDVKFTSNIENSKYPNFPNFIFDENGVGYVQNLNRGVVTRSFEWTLLVAISFVKKLSEKEKVFMLHCTNLEVENKSVLLFGRSGIGKSTTSQRFRDSGGVCRGDDLSLCYFNNGKLFAKVLPTFSTMRLRSDWQSLRYNFEPTLEVKSLYLLKRGDDAETIELNDPKEFLGILTQQMSSHISPFWKKQPADIRKTSANHLMDLSFEVFKKFQPLTLKANLDGDISLLEL